MDERGSDEGDAAEGSSAIPSKSIATPGETMDERARRRTLMGAVTDTAPVWGVATNEVVAALAAAAASLAGAAAAVVPASVSAPPCPRALPPSLVDMLSVSAPHDACLAPAGSAHGASSGAVGILKWSVSSGSARREAAVRVAGGRGAADSGARWAPTAASTGSSMTSRPAGTLFALPTRLTCRRATCPVPIPSAQTDLASASSVPLPDGSPAPPSHSDGTPAEGAVAGGPTATGGTVKLACRLMIRKAAGVAAGGAAANGAADPAASLAMLASPSFHRVGSGGGGGMWPTGSGGGGGGSASLPVKSCSGRRPSRGSGTGGGGTAGGGVRWDDGLDLRDSDSSHDADLGDGSSAGEGCGGGCNGDISAGSCGGGGSCGGAFSDDDGDDSSVDC